MEPSSWNIIFICLWFLLPIVPAYLLFKILPSKAIVKGPLKGLNIDLGGAFGGYFLLFLVAMGVMKQMIKNKYENYEVWNVHGRVVDSETSRPIEVSKNPFVAIQPPSKISPTGDFDFKIIGERIGENLIKFPPVLIDAEGYLPERLGVLDYKTNLTPTKEYCEELDCEAKRASYKLIKLMRIPAEPIQPKTVQDDTTTSIASN